MKNLMAQLLTAKLTPFNWENIKPTFTILWKGLVAIFAVILLIILVVQVVNITINKVEKARKERAEKRAQEQPQEEIKH